MSEPSTRPRTRPDLGRQEAAAPAPPPEKVGNDAVTSSDDFTWSVDRRRAPQRAVRGDPRGARRRPRRRARPTPTAATTSVRMRRRRAAPRRRSPTTTATRTAAAACRPSRRRTMGTAGASPRRRLPLRPRQGAERAEFVRPLPHGRAPAPRRVARHPGAFVAKRRAARTPDGGKVLGSTSTFACPLGNFVVCVRARERRPPRRAAEVEKLARAPRRRRQSR